MKAMGIQRFGGREVLESLELPLPQPGPHEVLIKIQAAGVNPVDWKIREGLFQGRMPHAFPIVLGWDASGVVSAIGEKVHYASVGDSVFAYCRKDLLQDGTYGEYITLRQTHLAPKPRNLSFEEAAGIPLAALTAYQVLFEGLHLKKDDKILIHAGAGGVGGFAIQIAKDIGAYVLTTASASHHDYLRSLGADEIIDYTRSSFVDSVKRSHPDGLDAVFDTVGGQVQIDSAEVLKRGGRLGSILAMQEDYFLQRGIAPTYVFVRPDSEQLVKIHDLAEAGKLKVKVAAVFPLEEARQAHELIQSGHTEGKIILKI
ncbi:MAG: NADP-dependent oxidoreductase [Deltaproteobacteria bacterium]|nr:NADP-dependent oxidoreductase [Deltaproteobacteria bacterium]